MGLIKPWRNSMRWIFAVGLMATFSAGAWAQVYNCTNPNGLRYQSRTPCPVGSKPPGITYHGPKPSAQLRAPMPASVPRAGEELGYMGPKCASMQDAIRTAPARGVDSRTLRDLRRNFELECQDERQSALRQLSADKREKRKQIDLEKREEQQQRRNAQDADQKLMDQCAEMRRALHLRRQRASTGEGDARDLQLFEERYQARCVQSASR